MQLNKKILAVTGLLAGVVLMASMTNVQQVPQQQPRPEPKLTNLKVFPKSIKYRELDHVMDEWAKALGVRCNFCHANNTTGRGFNYASDAKPEKLMARKMFLMENKINKKYFGAKKDSLGLMKETGINCNTCHKGTAHPKVVYANVPRPAGAPGAGPGGFGGPGAPGGFGGPGAPGGFGGPGAPAGAPRPATPATPPTNR